MAHLGQRYKEEVKKVNHALLDATFYNQSELPNRDMSEIPHPFVEESLNLFEYLPETEKRKIMFIHFNHTNPLIFDGPERRKVERLGYRIASEGDIIYLSECSSQGC